MASKGSDNKDSKLKLKPKRTRFQHARQKAKAEAAETPITSPETLQKIQENDKKGVLHMNLPKNISKFKIKLASISAC